jgi:tricorn protease
MKGHCFGGFLGLLLGGHLLIPARVSAQLTVPPRRPIQGARMPALSPDGKRLGFVYRGDIWLVSARGGRASQLTEHLETDAYPLFSPDGKWVAFASKRQGNWDIYAVPAEGGEARRLTYHSGTEIGFGWSPDGSKLLFSSRRDAPNYGLFALEVNSLRDDLLCEDYAPLNYPSWSKNGKKVVYGRYGFPWTRPRYQGSAAAQLWLYDVETKERHPITHSAKQHLWPLFLPDNEHIVAVTVGEPTPSTSRLGETVPKFVDSPERTPNLWRFDLEGHGEQLTRFSGGAVRWPTVAVDSGDLAFEYGPDLWVFRSGSKKPDKIKLFAAADEKQTIRRREQLKSGVTEAEPSPDGKLFAFGLKGDIWTIETHKPKGVAGRNAEFARRLTDWVGEDADFSWAPDGKKLYFVSDRDFNARLFELDLDTLKTKPIWKRMEDVGGLRVSPNGKQLGFWVSGPEGGLWLWNLETEESRRVVKVPGPQWHGMGGGDFAWSPDQKWIAYTYRGQSRAWNIWVVPTAGGAPVNVTRLSAQHSQPAWSPDGNYLFFQSNREGDGLYALPLRPEEVRPADTDIQFHRPTNRVEVVIDFQEPSRRIRKVSSQSPQGDLTITVEGQILFVSQGEIWSVSYDGGESRRLTSGGGKSQLRVSRDGHRLYYIQNGELWTMNNDGKGAEKVGFTADWERDIRAERQAAFTQFWRSYHRGFYDPNFHGRDWDAIRERYEPLLDSVETDDEFASLLQRMIGELETSHSEVKPGSGGVPAPVTPHLGFTLDYAYPGPGIKVSKVPEGVPAWYPKTRIKEGEYVLAINGEDVVADENLYRLINDKLGREFEFLVNDKPVKEGARTVQYKVLSQQEWAGIRYQDRVDGLRQYVDAQSSNRVGYVHIAAMGFGNQARFEREIYEYMIGKEAMIIDVRFNTGGNIADTLIDWLERKPHGFVRPRDGQPEPSPYRAWDKPIVVVMNEYTYSNAEIFSYAMRARHLARLVGKPTPGYVIWTDSLQLVDGTSARMPQSGFYRLDGSTQENNGEQPDVAVDLSPADWLAGRDPQIDEAIEMLLEKPSPKEPVVAGTNELKSKPAERSLKKETAR